MRRAWRIAAGPSLALAGVGLFWGSFTAWLPDIKAGAGLDDAQMGWVLLGTASGGLVATLLLPRLGRALGGWLMPAAAVAMAGATLLQLAGQGALSLLAALIAMGFAMSTLDVSANVRLSVLEAQHDVPLMNLAHGVFSLVYAGTAALSGVARGAGIGHWVVVAAVAVLLVAMAPALRAPDEPAAPAGIAAIRTPWAVILPGGLILFAAFIAEAGTETWSGLHIERTLQAPRGAGALGPAMMGLTMAAGRFAGQGLVARLGEVRLIVLSTLIGIAGAVLLAAAPTRGIAVVGVALVGLGCAALVPSANALIGRAVAPQQRPLAISRAWMLGFSGYFIGPVLLGWVAEGAGLRAAFLLIALFLALILPGLARLPR